jgi:hypothetical protein
MPNVGSQLTACNVCRIGIGFNTAVMQTVLVVVEYESINIFTIKIQWYLTVCITAVLKPIPILQTLHAVNCEPTLGMCY